MTAHAQLVEFPATSAPVREALVSKAVEDCRVVVWATDVEGRLVVSEGGWLGDIGLAPGEAVGADIRDWPDIPWDRMVSDLETGVPSVTYILQPTLPPGTREVPTSAWEVSWILSFAKRRTGVGRHVGYSCVTMPLSGATAVGKFTTCPLGACVVEESHGETDRRTDGPHPRPPEEGGPDR